MKRFLAILCCAASLLAPGALPAQTPAPAPAPAPRPERGIGPFTLQTRRGPVTARLVRRDRDLVRIDQLVAATGRYIETGIATQDLVRIEIPRPRILDVADQAATPEQLVQAIAAVRKVIDPLRPYRDLPGVPVEEALLVHGRLLERQGDWAAAYAIYDDIQKQPHAPPEAAAARLRSSLCLAKLGKFDEVLAAIGEAEIPDDDLVLLSDLYLARAQAKAGVGRHRDAIMDYLYLVVFDPFVKDNEPRCLEAVLPSYIAIGDWDAVTKTIAALRAQYPDTEFTKNAEALLAKHESELAAEAAYHAEPLQKE